MQVLQLALDQLVQLINKSVPPDVKVTVQSHQTGRNDELCLVYAQVIRRHDRRVARLMRAKLYEAVEAAGGLGKKKVKVSTR